MIDSRLRTRKFFLTIFGGITALVLFSLPYFSDPLIVDEAIFSSTIRSLAEHGVPHYYAGESVGWKPGLWHPPTYIYYVSVWFSAFGSSAFVARLATFLFSVLTVPAIAWLTLTLSDAIGDTEQRTAVLIAVALYVISPLVIQNGTLVDIDGSILALAVTLFVAWVIRTFGSTPENWPRALGLLGASIGFIAWIKFGALPVLLLSTAVYVGYQYGPIRGFHVCLAAAGGLVAFTVSWGIVASLLDLSFISPFAHNFGSLFGGGTAISTQKHLLLSAWALYTEIAWLSPFLLGLSALALTDRSRRLRSAPAFAFGIAALTILQYAVLAKVPYGFPKYLGIAMPLFSALAGVVVADVRRSVTELRTWIFLILIVISVATGMFLFGDPYIVPFNQGYTAVLNDTILTVTGVLGLTAVTGAILYRVRWTTQRHLVVAVLVVLLVGTNVGILAHQTSADYSTRYFYGIEGTDEAISATVDAYEDVPAERRSTTVVPVDFGFYIDGKFHAVKRYTVSEFEKNDPPLVVLRTQKYYAVESALFEQLKGSRQYTSERHGSYLIFTRRA